MRIGCIQHSAYLARVWLTAHAAEAPAKLAHALQPRRHVS